MISFSNPKHVFSSYSDYFNRHQVKLKKSAELIDALNLEGRTKSSFLKRVAEYSSKYDPLKIDLTTLSSISILDQERFARLGCPIGPNIRPEIGRGVESVDRRECKLFRICYLYNR